jgi:nucleotide-binding universal stress UspA family protein
MAQKTVLLAVDDDTDRSEKQARLVCDLFDPETVRVIVQHNFSMDDTETTLADLPSVDTAESTLTEAGFEVELYETTGKTGVSIVDTAEKFDADVVCLYARRRSPTGKMLFGSTAQNVIQSTERAVLLAPK